MNSGNIREYDVLIIGSGPGGEKAAVQASKLGKTVAVIERNPYIGGAGLHTGTLPSKTLRETALFLSGLKARAVYGFQCAIGRDVTLGELIYRKTEVIRNQMSVIMDHFTRNGIDIIYGEASFEDKNTLIVKDKNSVSERLRAEVIIISTGARPARPKGIPFDKDHVYDSDTILELNRLPQRLTIIGAGVIGCEYASIFSCLGVKVTLIEKRPDMLSFADREVVESLKYWMRHTAIVLRLGEEVSCINVDDDGGVLTELKSGKQVKSDKVLYTMGRIGNVDALNIKALGVDVSDRGIIMVNGNYQTSLENVYAVGDVIGFPSLASTSREQGRRAVCHALNAETGDNATGDNAVCALPFDLPFGIYTIPEISMVGKTEEELTKAGVPYESGSALFQEVARGQITGDKHGMLKLLFHRETLKLLGVHIICEGASELIHIGQAVLAFQGTIEYFKDVVFNYPTLSDAYKQAAMNGINKL